VFLSSTWLGFRPFHSRRAQSISQKLFVFFLKIHLISTFNFLLRRIGVSVKLFRRGNDGNSKRFEQEKGVLVWFGGDSVWS